MQKERLPQEEFTSQTNTASEPRFNIISERQTEGSGERFDVPALLLTPGVQAGRNVRAEIKFSLPTRHTPELSKNRKSANKIVRGSVEPYEMMKKPKKMTAVRA